MSSSDCVAVAATFFPVDPAVNPGPKPVVCSGSFRYLGFRKDPFDVPGHPCANEQGSRARREWDDRKRRRKEHQMTAGLTGGIEILMDQREQHRSIALLNKRMRKQK